MLPNGYLELELHKVRQADFMAKAARWQQLRQVPRRATGSAAVAAGSERFERVRGLSRRVMPREAGLNAPRRLVGRVLQYAQERLVDLARRWRIGQARPLTRPRVPTGSSRPAHWHA
jgi:hypothetical protein